MEALLLAIYSLFVWLIFIKLKWLPWNTRSQVIVVIIPVVAMSALILALNVFAPSTADVRVIKYVVNVVPQVKGRVLEVPVEPNRPVKKGDVLFRIDPTPYELQVRSLEAQLINTQASVRELTQQLRAAGARVKQAQAASDAARARVGEVQTRLELAKKRVSQNLELTEAGAGARFDLEQAQTNLSELERSLQGARSTLAQSQAAQLEVAAAEQQIRERLGARVEDEYAPVAQIRAQLDKARWELAQTTVVAPSNGYAINVQLRPGSMTAAFPVTPAITFVEDEFNVIAFFHQNELHKVVPGNEAEFSLRTHPGQVFKASVDSVIWAQGQGQVQMSSSLPQTGVTAPAPARFPVKLKLDPRHADLFIAAGATGEGAIYTDHLAMIHVIRKVILRIGAKLNYIIPKLH